MRAGESAIWTAATSPPAAAGLELGGWSRAAAELLARRGVTNSEEARAFLDPVLENLSSPFLLSGMEQAVDRLVRAQRDGESVAIVGDYDADGVTATALLSAVFRSSDLQTVTILPDRFQDGYGFHPRHAELASERGCGVLVTVDCGVGSHEAVGVARRLGLDVIVTDHHLPGASLPPGATIINPQVDGSGSLGTELAGVGLALKLGVGLLERLGRPVPLEALLRVACIGTIADVAPLLSENRIIAAVGLAALAHTRSPGLRALLRIAQVSPPVRAEDVAFRLAPRLNAAGRLASAELALELLTARDGARATELAQQLDQLNRERQGLELRAVEEARAHFFDRQEIPRILVAWSPDWHRGVVGIAAGRLARELHRPVLLLAQQDGIAVGSGRSIPGIDLHRFLLSWEPRLLRFGGHAQAVGLTATARELEFLRREWEDGASAWPEEWLRPRLEFELELSPAELTPELVSLLGRLEPHGAGNPEPALRIGPLISAGSSRAFGNGHLEVLGRGSAGGPVLQLVGWGWADRRDRFDSTFEAIVALRPEVRSPARISGRILDARKI